MKHIEYVCPIRETQLLFYSFRDLNELNGKFFVIVKSSMMGFCRVLLKDALTCTQHNLYLNNKEHAEESCLAPGGTGPPNTPTGKRRGLRVLQQVKL